MERSCLHVEHGMAQTDCSAFIRVLTTTPTHHFGSLYPSLVVTLFLILKPSGLIGFVLPLKVNLLFTKNMGFLHTLLAKYVWAIHGAAKPTSGEHLAPISSDEDHGTDG